MMLSALKAHVLKERQRKKEEHEEERLRKEREARERQDEMTLGETKEQIQKLEIKLKELRNQKQSLFLQLKKVLNEDEYRKKQQQQKDSELFVIQQMQQNQNLNHAQIFLPPRLTHPQVLHRGHNQLAHNQGIKRGRSPSPPLQGYYKSSPYSQSPKHEDGRRGADVSRVLWKQPPAQYQNPPGTLFYQTTANPPQPDSRPVIYQPFDPLRHTFHIQVPPQSQSNQQPGQNSSQHKPQVTMEKITDCGGYNDQQQQQQQQPPTHIPEGVVYTSLIQGISLHQMQQMQSNQSQNPKTGGSITQGYPNNRQPSGHSQQSVQPQQQQQILYPRRLF